MSSSKPTRWQMPGGIHPAENKQQSLQQPLRTLPLPPLLYVPLTQPHGSIPTLHVKVGDRVAKGQPLASGPAPLGLVVHAPAAGIVTAIAEHAVPNASALPELCATIATDAADTSAILLPPLDYLHCDGDVLLQRIHDTGIAGLGGAGFPTHAKLRAARGNVHTLIINAAECEPFITADDALLRERAADVLLGASIVLHITGAQRCLIGIEDDKPEAIAQLRSALDDPRFELVVIPTVYPHGAERQLIHLLTGVEVPSGSLPVDSGLLCHNPGTLYAITRAVVHGEPLLSRVTTFTGAALRAPCNVEVLLGTPVGDVLQACGLDEWQLSRLLAGGPLMGVQLPHAALPVGKTTNCIIATTETELPTPPAAQACIRCGLCAEVCPVRLLPQQLYWFSRSGELDKAAEHHLADCIECGACAYVCPSFIPLVQHYRASKAELAEQAARRQRAEHAKRRFDAHQARKDVERQLDEQRRAQRAEAAKAAKMEQAVPSSTAVSQDAVTNATAPPAQPAPSPQDVIAAALARVQAKKAAKAAADVASPTPPEEKPS